MGGREAALRLFWAAVGSSRAREGAAFDLPA